MNEKGTVVIKDKEGNTLVDGVHEYRLHKGQWVIAVDEKEK